MSESKAWVTVKSPMMSPFERQVWAAAYAQAFVAEFEFFKAHEGFDKGIRRACAETAVTIADAAVIKLRQYIVEETHPTAGLMLMGEHPPEWTE